MDIYLIRHAAALALGERGVTEDADRLLSEAGELQAREIGTGLQRRSVQIEKIVTSPLHRARQTAEGILHAWEGAAPELHICAHLAPDGKRKKLAKFLRQLGGDKLALIGHEPDLGVLAGWLIGSKKARIHVAKAGVAHLVCNEFGRGAGTLMCLVTSEWFKHGEQAT